MRLWNDFATEKLKWGFNDFEANEEGIGKGLTQLYEINVSEDASL